jgi:hypothetical protein
MDGAVCRVFKYLIGEKRGETKGDKVDPGTFGRDADGFCQGDLDATMVG